MKILIIHSYYALRGGEDHVFEQECTLLSKLNEVKKLSFQNHTGLKGFLQFFVSIWNSKIDNVISESIQSFKPDIIHVHNWHFASGPIIFQVCKRKRVPFVVTLHNYRLLCPSGTLYAKKNIYSKSLSENFPWSAIKDKVYKDSHFLTFWLGLNNWFHYKIGTWSLPQRYILLTESAKKLFSGAKFSELKSVMVVKPNFCEPFSKELPRTNRKGYLFVGRLTEEKGINILLNTFKNSDLYITIIGDGPLSDQVIEAGKHHKNIFYVPVAEKRQVLDFMTRSEALIVPSLWYEPFGLVNIEAFSTGTPVIANNIGAMASLIKHGHNGLHYDGSEVGLTAAVAYSNSLSEEERLEYGKNAFKTYNEYYSPERNYQQLMGIYREVIDGY